MQIKFKDLGTNVTFTVGRVSFDFLDNKNIFDEFQEDKDPHSEIILLTSANRVEALAKKIGEANDSEPDLRADIKFKLKDLCVFIDNSEGIQVTID